MQKPKNQIALLRWRNVLSQKDVADKLGISAAYWCKLENNPKKIDLGMAEKLKDILNINCIDDLLKDAI